MAYSTVAEEAKTLEGRLLSDCEKMPVGPGDKFSVEIWTDREMPAGVLETLRSWKCDLLRVVGVDQTDTRLLSAETEQRADKPPELGDWSVEIAAEYTTDPELTARYANLAVGVTIILKALAWLGISYAVTRVAHYATTEEGGKALADTTKRLGSAVSETAWKTAIPVIIILALVWLVSR